jgi:hypothetical protein
MEQQTGQHKQFSLRFTHLGYHETEKVQQIVLYTHVITVGKGCTGMAMVLGPNHARKCLVASRVPDAAN